MRYIKIGILFWVSFISFPAFGWFADWADQESTEYNTYYGIDYKQAWVRPVNDWRYLFNKDLDMVDIYGGIRFWDVLCIGRGFFGAEIGYEWANNRPDSIEVPPGNTFLGVTNNTTQVVTLTGKTRIKGGHIDLSIFIPLLPVGMFCYSPEAILTVGIGDPTPTIRIYARPEPNLYPFPARLTVVEGRRNPVWRAGLGAQMLFFKRLGLRVLWRWEGTHNLRGRFGVAEEPATRDLFEDGHSLAVGLYLVF